MIADSKAFSRLVGIGIGIERAGRGMPGLVEPLLHQLNLLSLTDVRDLGASLERLEGLAHDATHRSAREATTTEGRLPPPVHWRESGRGPVLILLNGWSVSGLVWPSAWVQRLERRFRVVRIDNRGTGWSRRAPRPFCMADLADDVVAVLDAMGVKRASVLGLSMGGMVAQEVALRAPERVEHLFVVASRPPAPRQIGAAPDMARGLVSAPPADRPVREHLRGLWESSCAPGFADTHQELIEEMVDQIMIRPTARPFLITQLRAILAWRGADRLRELRVPTVVVHGTLDQLMPVGNGMRVAQLIPNARYVELPDVGHLVPLEAPGELSSLVETTAARPRGKTAAARS